MKDKVIGAVEVLQNSLIWRNGRENKEGTYDREEVKLVAEELICSVQLARSFYISVLVFVNAN